jgi:hypothetical protein
MKYFFLFFIFKFYFTSNSFACEEVDVGGKPSNTLQPLMILYDPEWHWAKHTSDIHGVHALIHYLNRPCLARDPFLYKISKDEKVFHMLGTLHDLPLLNLPAFVKDIVYGCETLICERYLQSTENHALIFRSKYCDPSHSWFDQLNLVEQMVFNKVCCDMDSADCSLINERRIDIRIMPEIYEQAHYQLGMDMELQDYFEKKGSRIIGLDTPEENDAFHEELIIKDAESAFARLRLMIATTLKHKGLINYRFTTNDFKVYYQYLLGNIAELKDSLVNSDDQKYREDQERWWPRLKALIDRLDIKVPCVAVGIGHCIWDGGLLDFAFKEGWTIEKYYVNDPQTPELYVVLPITHDQIL